MKLTDIYESIPEIIARDMSIQPRNYTLMDGFYLKQWVKKGLIPAQQELDRRIEVGLVAHGVSQSRKVK